MKIKQKIEKIFASKKRKISILNTNAPKSSHQDKNFEKTHSQNKTAWYKRNIFILIGLFFFLMGGILTYKLSPIPFGFSFAASFYLCIGGLFFTLFMVSFRLLKKPGILKKIIGSLLLLVTVIPFTSIFILLIDHRVLHFQSLPPKMTEEKWLDDLMFLKEELPKRHPDFFSLVSRNKFYSTIEDIEKRIPTLTDNQIMMEFFKVVALPNDDHTEPNFLPCYNLHFFPLKIFLFDDGWYVTETSRKFKSTFGSRLIKIGGMPIEDVYNLYKPYLAAENEYAKIDRFSFFTMVAEWLQSQGIIEEIKKGTFTLVNAKGEHYSIAMKPVKLIPFGYWYIIRRVENISSPAITNARKDYYWFEFLDESNTLYFQFNAVVNQSSKNTIRQFAERFSTYINTHEFDRLVIDIRNNFGGGGQLLFNLMDIFKNNKEINQKGKLFVIIGRTTHSAAVMFASMLKNNTKAIFVGEPTHQGPLFYSTPTTVRLPNSRLEFSVSSRFTPASVSCDKSQWIAPDIPVKYTYQDFIDNRDPAMEAILAFKTKEIETVDLEPKTVEKYTGRYVFSPYQILTIERQEDRLAFSIDDFHARGYTQVKSDLYPISERNFLTDIKDVTLQFPSDEQTPAKNLILKWGDSEMVLQRAQDGFLLPMELISQGKIKEGMTAFLENREEQIQSNPYLEANLNSIGYRYLRDKKYREAIEIFKLNVELFPHSSNVYDSLGDAYRLNGDKELAIQNYQKSLELNPDNTNAERMLKSLEKIDK